MTPYARALVRFARCLILAGLACGVGCLTLAARR